MTGNSAAKRRRSGKLRPNWREKAIPIVPCAFISNDKNWSKIEIGLAKGKNRIDKRESIKQKDVERDEGYLASLKETPGWPTSTIFWQTKPTWKTLPIYHAVFFASLKGKDSLFWILHGYGNVEGQGEPASNYPVEVICQRKGIKGVLNYYLKHLSQCSGER